MTDTEIIQLYWQRDESAVSETDIAYGTYCRTIAGNILQCDEDTEESVNDTYFAVWNSLPPDWPDCLKAYIGCLCRRISISAYRRGTAKKRGGCQSEIAIEELSAYLPDKDGSPETTVELKELAAALSTFLRSLPDRERNVFMARYWYVMPINDISARLSLNINTVKTILRRTRQKLARYLEKEGLI